MSKAGFKVIKLDWYCDFKVFTTPYVGARASKKKQREIIDLLQEDGEENPLTYIEECGDPGFPPREHIKYCVAVKNGKPQDSYYKPYQCFCFQHGKWWKYKEIQYIFTDLYQPQCMTHYEFCKYNAPLKFLSKAAYLDWLFYSQSQYLIQTRRRAQMSVLSTLGRIKQAKKQKSKLP